MSQVDSLELSKVLELFDGLRDNPSKRMEICKYVEENNLIAVFGYGSLLWNQIRHVNDMIYNCTLEGYRKGFICEDIIYRGTKRFTGLTMGLEEDSQSYVKGALLIATAHQIIPFVEAFLERETPTIINGVRMNIYRYDFVKVILPDGITCGYALTCIVNEKSEFHMNPRLTLDQQAKKMALAYGQNGTNLQYLQRAIYTYEQLKLKDSCTDELEELFRQVIFYRQNLPTTGQDLLRIYDELSTMEERQRTVNSYALVACQASVEPWLHRSMCIQRLFSQVEQPQSA